MKAPKLGSLPAGAPAHVGVLARMRVGTKLLLLVLLPVCGFLAFASITTIEHWHTANHLRDFRRASQLSFRSADLAEALAHERTAVTLSRLRAGSDDSRQVAVAQRAVDVALARAAPQEGEHPPVDVAGRLQRARRRLDAVRRQTATGSIGLNEIVEDYGVIVRDAFGIVRDLDSGRPSRATGRAATAYVALLQGIEGAEMERVTVAAALVRGTDAVRVRGVIVEAGALDDFRQYADRDLVAQLNTLLVQPAGATVTGVRKVLVQDPARLRRAVSLSQWLAASGTRIGALRRVQHNAAGGLTDAASADLGAARASARRAVASAIAVLLLVLGFGVLLWRSITRPLREVSEGARMLSAGQLDSGVSYVGHDEIGEVAAAFRDLHLTAERVALEIRAMNAAVDDDRLDHRADIAPFEGRWAELMGGVNDTMAAFADLQGRREGAERQADRIFDVSQDLLCIAGFDGYFKRVNPAFERLLGHPTEVLLSRPTREFIHPDDRAWRDDGHQKLAAAEDVLRFDLRQLCRDGSVVTVEWTARVVAEEQLIYAVGRDVTGTRRAADEQAALRRVATLVAKRTQPEVIFGAVAREVRALVDAAAAAVMRRQADGSLVVVGSAMHGPGASYDEVAAAAAKSGCVTRVDGAVGAPIVVEDKLWGVVVASEGAETLPAAAEDRLGRFTDLVATAIANAQSRAEVAASRARVVEAADEERRRVVRDLHDGAQQGLVHTIFTLQLASSAMAGGDEEAPALMAEALDHARRAMRELRELSHGILPVAVTSGGLSAGIEALASRVPLPVETEVPAGRLPSVVEATAYFVVSEALTNIIKHAGAAHVDVTVQLEGDVLRIAVRDDGVGGARTDGTGLVGVRDRLEALHGWLRVDSPPRGGTLLTAEIPLSGPASAKSAPPPGSASPPESHPSPQGPGQSDDRSSSATAS